MILNERGEIISSSIGTNRDSDVDVRLFKTQLLESEDSQTVQQYQISGFESRPPAGSKIIVAEIGSAYKISIGEDDGVLNDSLEEGEAIGYSIDSGAIQAFIKFLKTGILHVNGDADFAVSWTDLNTQLQALVASINAALATKQDSPGSPGTLTLDLTTAKVTTVKLP